MLESYRSAFGCGVPATPDSEIQKLKAEIMEMNEDIEQERKRICRHADAAAETLRKYPGTGKASFTEALKRDAEPNRYVGFVTFRDRADAVTALQHEYSMDAEEFVTSMPPEPGSIRWDSICRKPSGNYFNTFVGYFLTSLLYIFYMPCVVKITTLASNPNIRLGWFQSFWNGLAPTLGLFLMVSFLPTFLSLIFSNFFPVVSDALVQIKMQKWYFFFQVVFVLLTASIGNSVVGFTEEILADPFSVFDIIARSLPSSTHFYMNLIIVQWYNHSGNLMRRMPLINFIRNKRLYPDDHMKARELAEPEDPDYYGIGSRSTRLTIDLLIGIIFSTICPVLAFLVFIDFGICRVVYSYNLPFAETIKPDSGGKHFLIQLHHVFFGLVIYIIMMTGVLAQNGAEETVFCLSGGFDTGKKQNIRVGCLCWPAWVSLSSGVFLAFAWRRFSSMRWKKLTFAAVIDFIERSANENLKFDQVCALCDKSGKHLFYGQNWHHKPQTTEDLCSEYFDKLSDAEKEGWVTVLSAADLPGGVSRYQPFKEKNKAKGEYRQMELEELPKEITDAEGSQYRQQYLPLTFGQLEPKMGATATA